jgi:hypothetical protein
MGQTALKIRPYFPAHIGPAAAKTEILAEINARRSWSIMQLKSANRQGLFFKRIIRPVFTAVFQFGIAFNHFRTITSRLIIKKPVSRETDFGETVLESRFL